MPRRSLIRWFLRLALIVVAFAVAAAAAGAAFEWYDTRSAVAKTPAPGRLIDLGGYRLHLYCEGTGSPTVVLDAGLGDSYLVWGWVQPRLAARTRVCSYDRAGAGYSDPSPRPRTSEVIAQELHSLLQRGGVTPPLVLVGWSAAGFHIRSFTAQYPGEVRGLVFVDASHEDQQRRFPESVNAGARAYFDSFRWSALRMAVGFGRLRRPGRGALWEAPLEPGSGNNLALQMPVVRAQLANAEATGYRLSWYRSTIAEWDGFPASAEYARRTRRVLKLPIVVVSAGVAPPLPGFGEVWNALQADLTTLSPHSRRIIAPRANHQGMGSLGADSVVVGVLDVLRQVRESDSTAAGATPAGTPAATATAR